MGAKDSKPSFISYEDAVKRVSNSELRRIREAFKRCAGANGTALSLEAFVHEVLCDGVPYEVAEWLYQGCGGTKRGIAFKELLCGIVVLTKGNIEEKIKFLWTLYTNNQGENGTYIYKRDFARTLHLENTSLPVTGAQRSAEILLGLFGPGDKVTFDQFRSWLLIHKDATVLSKWLLSDLNVTHDLETPTFYQSLAGVTHLEERDIIELEKCFWSLRHSAPTGELDIESLTPLLSPPLPPAAVPGTFLAFDENRDGHVDFKELCCGLSAACRGPRTERLKFCFKIFDLDSDGVLNKKELVDMVAILCTVANEHSKNCSRASTPDEEPEAEGFHPDRILANLREKLVVAPRGKKPVFQLGTEEMIVLTECWESGTISADTVLTLEDFLIWSVESADGLVSPFLALLFETCHIVLGLRPQCKHHERNIVLGWLRRWTSRGYLVGQFWYLVEAEWWRAWNAHTRHAEPCARAPCALPLPQALRHARAVDDAIVCDESFTTDSTESMGSLAWRCESASLGSGSGSAGSSSGVGSAPRGLDCLAPPRPPPIDNSRLIAHTQTQVRSLTGEGGHVRRDVPLVQHRDFELVPDALWRALAHWYSAPDPLPRQVIRPQNSEVELELYPLQLLLYRHVPSTQRASTLSAGAGVSLYSAVPLAPAPPERQLAYTAAFSRLATVKQVIEFLCSVLGLPREDVRLWALGGSAVLLDDERPTLQELQLHDRSRVLLELRNPDLTWPEEIGALSMSSGGSRATERRETLVAPNLPGATGLHNLGNTCYMNAALQSVWNTGPLTRYFNSGMHLYEVNMNNPLGTRGALALRYGELCKEVWSMRARSVAPLRVRWCVSRHARALAGGGQHDAQELLAWLLDALHEDLNRARPAQAQLAPHADSDGRPDQVVAAEAWSAHTARNDSIMTQLFCGQLKSRVKCEVCATESVRFDAFNMLSLPLPMESYVRARVRVILLNGSVPIKYGVRVNSEGTYLDLKKNLSELCGLAPDSMLIVELNGCVFGRVFEDSAKVSAASANELYAYETPARAEGGGPDEPKTNGWGGRVPGGAGWRAEVSVGAGNTSSLCMPALFCFKRSRSETLMSQSPPATFLRSHSIYTDTNEYRSSTLPKDAKKDITNSPTLSVKSLNLKPSSPRLGRVQFSPSPSLGNEGETRPWGGGRVHYLVAVHRKQCRADAYFLPSQRSRPALFGVPLVVGLRPGMSGRALYGCVWTQVARLLSARPPPADTCNHATDCDDSLGYEFPFTLRLVSRGGAGGVGGVGGAGGAWCGHCPWPRTCRGCALPTGTEPLVVDGSGEVPPSRKPSATAPSLIDDSLPNANSPIAKAKLQRQASSRTTHNEDGTTDSNTLSTLDLSLLGGARHGLARACMLAIEWDPTALHLRYQSTRERHAVEHDSVKQEAAEAAKAIDLQSCLRAFTLPEQLEERYHCSRCKENQPATKTLQLWRAPPILIIHLKRFQYVNNKWIKSQKVVNFPFQDFDPTEYLASVPRETILRHREISHLRRSSSVFVDEPITESESEDDAKELKETKNRPKVERRRRSSIDAKRRERLESTSLRNTPVTDDNMQDFHQHLLLHNQDAFDLKYRLYAVVSHSGQLSGGHYVAYARNPSGAWLCYNDSSCRELNPHPAPPIDPAAAYLLFYERQGLDYEQYLPDIRGREPVVKDCETLDPDETDLKKMCVLT